MGKRRKRKTKKVASGMAVFLLIWWEKFSYSVDTYSALIFWPLHPLVQRVIAML
jgi:hypothetical protein